MSEEQPRKSLLIYVNGQRYERQVNPVQRLSDFIHELGLRGTKTVCKEGGCGACVVVISRFDHNKNKVVNFSANSCVVPLAYCDGCHITTVEGLGTPKNPHAIQKAFSQATQCGYCTPGFVMTSYAAKLNGTNMLQALDSNLCRCTGYTSIYKAMHEIEDLDVKPVFAFPEELKQKPQTVILQNPWYGKESYKAELAIIPTQLHEVADFIDQHPKVLFINGGSEVLVRFKRTRMSQNICFLHQLRELQGVHQTGDLIRIGGSASISSVVEFLKEHHCKCSEFFEKMYDVFASLHVRNVGTVAGNIMHGSYVSDNIPVFQVLQAKIGIINTRTGEQRVIPINELIVNYHVTSL